MCIKGIREAIVKASRFIINSDYITTQNDDEFTLSVAIPSSYYVPRTQIKKFTASTTVKGATTKDYRFYVTSTAYNYACVGGLQYEIVYGTPTTLTADIERSNDTFTLSVYAPADTVDRTYSGTSQVITAHIQTFVDPFQV